MNTQDKINSIDNEINALNRRFRIVDTIDALGCVFTFASGIAGLFLQPLLGITMLGLSAGVISAKINNYEGYSSKFNALVKEKNSLVRAARGNVNTSKEASMARTNKIQKLKNIVNDKYNDMVSKKTVGHLLTAGLLTGTAVGLFVPGPFSFVAPGLAFLKICHDKTKMASIKDYNNTVADLNSTKNEQKASYELINTAKKKIVKTNTRPVVVNTVKTKQKPVVRTTIPVVNNDTRDGYIEIDRPKVYVKK